MAVFLSSEGIFSAPLSFKPARFFGLARRAVSLLAVSPIILVPFRAVRFSCIQSRRAVAVLKRVFPDSYAGKVLGVNARPVSAVVIDDISMGNWPMDVKPRHAMRPAVKTPQVEGSIAVSIKRACPIEAAARALIGPRQETFKFFIGHVHANGIHGPSGECNRL